MLPDGAPACAAAGDAALVLLATRGVLRLRELHKHDHDAPPAPEGAADSDGADITCVCAAPAGGAWWAWWGDTRGRLRRLRLPPRAAAKRPAELLPALPPLPAARLEPAQAETLLEGTTGSEVRGVAVDPVSERVYWTSVSTGAPGGGVEGALHVAALDGRRRVTLWRQRGAEPDDVIISIQTG